MRISVALICNRYRNLVVLFSSFNDTKIVKIKFRENLVTWNEITEVKWTIGECVIICFAIHMLTQQYRYMMKQYREADQTNKTREAARYRKMIEHIIPVLASAASYLQQKNPESSLLVWMKEEIKSC